MPTPAVNSFVYIIYSRIIYLFHEIRALLINFFLIEKQRRYFDRFHNRSYTYTNQE